MTGTCFVYAEDMVGVIIGPFASPAEAEAHIAFCAARGDAARATVIAPEAAEALRAADSWLETMTPEEDRAFDVEACIARVESEVRMA